MGLTVVPHDAPLVAVDWDVECGELSPSNRPCQHPSGHGGCCNTWGRTEHKTDEAWWARCWKVGCTAKVVPGWRGCSNHKR